MATTAPNLMLRRWFLAGAAVLVQLALGAVYAWSVFVKPFQKEMGWSKSQAALPFTVTIGVLFLGTFLGGRIQDRVGPRPVVLTGGVIYAIGVLLATFVKHADQLWLLVLTYGAIAGFGLGMGYIVPIAMLVKWFPDRRGLITGIAVGGFGAGALVTAPIANRLIKSNPNDVAHAFLILGIGYLAAVLIGGAFFRNPPADYRVPGWDATRVQATRSAYDYSLAEALRTPQWYMLTAILTLNVTAGIALISQASPAAQQITGVSADTAAGLVGFLAIFNGGGRVLWAWLSDTIGRMRAFMGMFALEALCFLILPSAAPFVLFAVLAALIYLCYGGGFGTMPATAADFFGVKNAGGIYGAMIVAWSIGGVIGPLAIAKLLDINGNSFRLPFYLIAAMALVSLALPVVTRKPAERAADGAPVEEMNVPKTLGKAPTTRRT